MLSAETTLPLKPDAAEDRHKNGGGQVTGQGTEAKT